jgi:CubicO group peptidase (beta-lactamase class C family)
MTTWQEIAAAETFLAKTLREYVAQCNVPALAGVLVRDAGATIVSAQQGIRKVGASGDENIVQDTDRFNLGSISKVFAAHLIGALKDAGIHGLDWSSTLGQVMPELAFPNPVYKDVTIDQYSAHVSSMPYTPGNEPWGVYEPANDAAGLALLHLNAVQRRMVYVQKALKDPSITKCNQPPDSKCKDGVHDPGVPGETPWLPGEKFNYSGGQVINAAMVERLTGRVFEDLMQQYIFGPLKMTRSRFGRASFGQNDGPWQHEWKADKFTVEPFADPQSPAADTAPRNPVGGMCCNAADFGRFLAESVRPDPRVFNRDILHSMQNVQVFPASSYTRGAWVSVAPGTPGADLWYVGDDGYMLATVNVYLSKGTAVGAMSNVNDTLSRSAAGDMQATGQAFDAHWDELFGAGAPESVECAHPMPALVSTGYSGQDLTVFARQRNGEVIHRQSTDGGKHWGAAIPMPGWIMTSGLAAGATPDGSHMFLFGRGTDNQIWFAKASGRQGWQGSWPVPFGTFMTGPAVAITVSGQAIGIHLVAVGMDRHMYYIHSGDGGQTWSQPATIGNGTFTSAPAIIASKDGNVIRVFGRGDDFRIWNNWNANPGWQPHWAPIGQGIFSSGPAATASDDGTLVHVMARATDRNMWQNWTTGYGTPFQPHWQPLAPMAPFISAPALAMSGVNIHAAAFGDDFTIWANYSADAGESWTGFSQVGPNPGLFI